MYLAYFDEVKPSFPERPFFFIGGLVVEDKDVQKIEQSIHGLALDFFGKSTLGKDTELHGIEIFRGNGACKGRSIEERLVLFRGLIDILSNEKIKKFLVTINCEEHRRRYVNPEPEYNLGLMFYIEMVEKFLSDNNSLGMLFGDHEKDQVEKSIINLSEFRLEGTRYRRGKKINCILDTLYFAQSHHSRLVQLADVFMYLSQLNHYGDNKTYMHESVRTLFHATEIVKECHNKRWL